MERSEHARRVIRLAALALSARPGRHGVSLCDQSKTAGARELLQHTIGSSNRPL
jgi:hypothetical protein